MIGKLTYETKTNPNAVTDRTKQATAQDFNEIKTVVNNCVDGINWIKCDEVNITAGTTRILFNEAYPEGIPFAILIHEIRNSKGYLVSHGITNKDRFGFDVTVSSAGVMVYLTAPRR